MWCRGGISKRELIRFLSNGRVLRHFTSFESLRIFPLANMAGDSSIVKAEA